MEKEKQIALAFLIFAQELETEIGKWSQTRQTYETNYAYEGVEYNEEALFDLFIKEIYNEKA